MKYLALLLVFCVQFIFAPEPELGVKLEVHAQTMVAIEDITLPSGYILPKGSIVTAFCSLDLCVLTDMETGILRKSLQPFEWFKPLSYNI